MKARQVPKDHPGRAYNKVWDNLGLFSKDSNLMVLNGARICVPRQSEASPAGKNAPGPWGLGQDQSTGETAVFLAVDEQRHRQPRRGV